ncbi:MAG: OmpA family protein [Deltaproteobacteria bacterium]|nr:OmpA family protein [Deltaproteobacteria bacterium]
MTRRFVALLVVFILGGALGGCAHIPKPKELLDLASLRESKEYPAAQEKQPDLVRQSDDSYFKSVESWRDKEIEDSKYWATLGTIKLRTALSMVKEEAVRQRAEAARKELAELKKREKELKRQLLEADEQLALHAKLEAARKAAEEKEAQLKAKLSEAQRREEEQKRLAEAQTKVSEAALALKQADTVEAAKYAPNEYGVAQALVARAEAALKDGKISDAVATADMARSRAEAALAAARPQYVAARKVAERQARNQALQKDAAAIGGVTVRMKAVGETQQLIMPVPDLFKRAETAPRADKKALLNEIGALVKKYAEYPVIVNGYTSNRVRPSQQYSVSQARAQEVANHFVSLGIEFKRMATAGRGSENPIAGKASPLNDRVEIILLFQ